MGWTDPIAIDRVKTRITQRMINIAKTAQEWARKQEPTTLRSSFQVLQVKRSEDGMKRTSTKKHQIFPARTKITTASVTRTKMSNGRLDTLKTVSLRSRFKGADSTSHRLTSMMKQWAPLPEKTSTSTQDWLRALIKPVRNESDTGKTLGCLTKKTHMTIPEKRATIAASLDTSQTRNSPRTSIYPRKSLLGE